MAQKKVIQFSVKDIILDEEVSPSNITLPLLAEFTEQVILFLRGKKRTNLNDVKASIKKGSLAVAVKDEVGILEDAYSDYKKVVETRSLVDIDPIRAGILQDWQKAAQDNEDRKYSLGFDGEVDSEEFILIDSSTEFETTKDIWVNVELYVYGMVYDMGGKSKTNVHIELENGKSIKVGTRAAVLINDDENRIYRKQLIRISAKKNLETGDLENERLLSFEYYNPEFDEKSFQAISKKARAAWKEVSNPTEWVNELRGSNV